MRLTTIIACAILGLAITSAPSANAQNLGGIFNKAKKAVEKVDKVLNPEADKSKTGKDAAAPEAKAVLSANGISMTNPLSEFLQVEPVGLVGVPQSEKWGTAYLVLKVKNLLPDVADTLFGSSTDPKDKMIASDGNGTIFQVDAGGGYRFDTPADILVKVDLAQSGLQFMNVPRTLDMMEMVRVNVVMNAYHRGNLTLKNVPITWIEEEPEDQE